MTILSIRNVPDAVVERLRARAQRNARSLQAELLAIVTEAVPVEGPVPDYWAIYEEAKKRGLGGGSAQTVAWIREDRDSR